ncbi:MAG: hypothetical protein BWY87_01341 [Deltaproteobacteria bacterium ADurb.Bin510]|nr:MAG: hypothetical protein BWY87_01341 [Deltaproteobacteria bacterium ADurb.Bin510]
MRKAPILIVLVALTGCAGQRYEWGGYEDTLYRHYRRPAEAAEFTTRLGDDLHRAETSGKVPPGLYAEYGYALYEAGRYAEAQDYFKRESDLWPESRVLMARLIELCAKAQARAAQPEARP